MKAVQELKTSDEKEQKKDQDDIADRKQIIAVRKKEIDDLKQQMQSLSAAPSSPNTEASRMAPPRPHT